MRLYSLAGGEVLGQSVANALDRILDVHEERCFEDGEHKIRALQSVEDCDVFIVQSLFGEPGSSVNDKLIRLLFFAGGLKDAGAKRIHAVCPYLCYARKDRRTKSRDPVSIRYVAQLFEAVGIASVTALDVHNEAAFDNAFRCRTIRLSARRLFARYIDEKFSEKRLTVASPDLGGAKRADAFRETVSALLGRPVGTAIMEKHRSGGRVSGDLVAGDIAGRCILLLDDLIAGGTTMKRACLAFMEAGASEVHALATHGVFAAAAADNLAVAELDSIVVTNSIGAPQSITSGIESKLVRLDVAALLAGCIHALRAGGSADAESGIVPGA